MSSIRISQLNEEPAITSDDFIPIVDSGSLTTFRTPISVINAWWAVSGSAVTASFAAHSLTSVSASWASRSVSSATASHLLYPNNSTASYAMNALSASWADRSGLALSALNTPGTASWALDAISASWANTSSIAHTASYYNFTIPANVPPFATASLSSSWASASFSSSYAITASYAQTAATASYVNSVNTPGIPKAWATCVSTASVSYGGVHYPGIDWHWMDITSSYNVSSVTKGPHSGVPYTAGETSPISNYSPYANPYIGVAAGWHWLVTLTNPLPSTNYTVIGGAGGEQASEYIIMTMYPFQNRTTTQFTLSACLGNTNFSPSSERFWFSFMVFHNP